MNTTPDISVVLPTFNRENLIQNAVRSILDQTFENWELIVVDDGSTDGTERVVDSFANPRIRFLKLEHTGHITKVRNIGCDAARAELIVVQDSDDMSFPNRLEEIWKCYKKTNADLIYHSFYARYYDPYHDSITRKCHPAKPFNREALLVTQYIPGQVAYKRKKVLETPYNEKIIIADDYILLLEFAMKGYSFQKIDEYLYDYVDSPDSLNMVAESDGRRQKDAETIREILRGTYKVNL